MECNSEIISKLKFIGKIQEGDKINVKYMFIQPAGIVTSFSRSFINQDTRGNTFNFISNTYQKSFEIIKNIIDSGKFCDKNMCINIIKDLQISKGGLKHLKVTYKNDMKFCCDLDTLTEEIDVKISELFASYPKIFENNE